MMDTAGKQKQRLRKLRQTFQNMGNPLYDNLLTVSLQHGFLIHGYSGKPVGVIQLRRGQHHAPKAALCTDKDLMALRQQHADMYNGPPAPGGRAVFQTVCKRRQTLNLTNGKSGSLKGHVPVRQIPVRSRAYDRSPAYVRSHLMQTFKHRPFSPLPPRRQTEPHPPALCIPLQSHCLEMLPSPSFPVLRPLLPESCNSGKR